MGILGKILILIGLTASAQAQSQIVRFGTLALGGNACRLGGVGPLHVSIEDGRLQIPAASLVQKVASDSLERGTCQFTVPVQLATGYRLVLKDLSVLGDLNLARGTASRIDVEVFEAGSTGPRLTDIDGSTSRKVRKSVFLRKEGVILVSDCGAALNLRGNSAVTLQGAGATRSSGALHLIEMSAEVQKCR